METIKVENEITNENVNATKSNDQNFTVKPK